MRKLHLFINVIIFFGILSLSNTTVFAMIYGEELDKLRYLMLRGSSQEIPKNTFEEKIKKHSHNLITHTFLYGTFTNGKHQGKTIFDLYKESEPYPVLVRQVFEFRQSPIVSEIDIKHDASRNANWTSNHSLEISLQNLRGRGRQIIDEVLVHGVLVLSMDTITVTTGFEFSMSQVIDFFKALLTHAFMEIAFLEDDLLTSIPLTASIQTKPPKHLQDLGTNLLTLQQSLEAANKRIQELEQSIGRLSDPEEPTPVASTSSS